MYQTYFQKLLEEARYIVQLLIAGTVSEKECTYVFSIDGGWLNHL